MKKEDFLPAIRYLLICTFLTLLFLTLLGCAKPNMQLPKSLPPIIKEYKHVTLIGSSPGMKKTGVYMEPGDLYSILASGSVDLWAKGAPPGFKYHDVRPELGWPLIVRIGEHPAFYPFYTRNGFSRESYQSGHIYVGCRDGQATGFGEPLSPEDYRDNMGAFSVDIIVWKGADWIKIADFLSQVLRKEPSNKAVADVHAEAEEYASIARAEQLAKKEIEKTEQKISELKKNPAKRERNLCLANNNPQKRWPKRIRSPSCKQGLKIFLKVRPSWKR